MHRAAHLQAHAGLHPGPDPEFTWPGVSWYLHHAAVVRNTSTPFEFQANTLLWQLACCTQAAGIQLPAKRRSAVSRHQTVSMC